MNVLSTMLVPVNCILLKESKAIHFLPYAVICVNNTRAPDNSSTSQRNECSRYQKLSKILSDRAPGPNLDSPGMLDKMRALLMKKRQRMGLAVTYPKSYMSFTASSIAVFRSSLLSTVCIRTSCRSLRCLPTAQY